MQRRKPPAPPLDHVIPDLIRDPALLVSRSRLPEEARSQVKPGMTERVLARVGQSSAERLVETAALALEPGVGGGEITFEQGAEAGVEGGRVVEVDQVRHFMRHH